MALMPWIRYRIGCSSCSVRPTQYLLEQIGSTTTCKAATPAVHLPVTTVPISGIHEAIIKRLKDDHCHADRLGERVLAAPWGRFVMDGARKPSDSVPPNVPALFVGTRRTVSSPAFFLDRTPGTRRFADYATRRRATWYTWRQSVKNMEQKVGRRYRSALLAILRASLMDAGEPAAGGGLHSLIPESVFQRCTIP